MLNKVILLLSMSLNLVLSLVILANTSRPLRAVDFRDAVSDRPATGRLMSDSLGSADRAPATRTAEAVVPSAPAVGPLVSPLPAAEIPASAAPADGRAAVSAPAPAPAVPVRAQAAARAKTAAPKVKAGNDWAAYKRDAAGEPDIFISSIFRSRKRGEKAMAARVRGYHEAGKEVLFSCVLREKSGGVFYMIRLLPPPAPARRIPMAADLRHNQAFLNDLMDITYKAEAELQNTL